ncbi:MBL fold metallo-hydrolase [soil metagenome]|jgi:L-ascorbate metabolism protein UlaG (beta-lactamase superfamily)
MQITKYTHACVRLEQGGGVLVIDPGIWSEPRALLGANAVLVTHEHVDHVDVLRLAGLGVPVYAPADARIAALEATRGLIVIPMTSGQECTAAGFKVRAVGSRHAFIYDGQPDCANLGYVVEDRLYHPGDALHVPDQPIETLLVPVHGSWLRTDEAIDFVKAVKPQRTFAIHDAQLNERGLDGVNAWLAAEAASGYRYLAPGEAAA